MAAPIFKIKIYLGLTAEAHAWPSQPLRAGREESVQKAGLPCWEEDWGACNQLIHG
jgi:hypothetical protein